MAVVYRALDVANGRAVALKRLRSEASGGAPKAAVALFEREYLTLSQLAHPRVVQVYDYGVDDDGPYYTMELLDGGDLQALTPVPWPRLCLFARDICSALALLHSRRLVYRDLSPRNVRCTSDGLAKLIDFGAMSPMGLTRELVGTAPCVPPEALNLQPLDARSDLYALGATLYFALVQRHAYPARELSQLPDMWRSRPRRPSEIVPDIPQALDRLIMDLVQLDPALRPANAAEVMARVSALAGVRASEQGIVAQAYLSNPTLVGRADLLGSVRNLTWKALQRRGTSLLIRGAPGVGRSRFLDACVLEAKLAGLLVLRVDASDSQTRTDFGIARSIAKQLLEAARPLALQSAGEYLPLLARLLPELHEAEGKATHLKDEPLDMRQLQAALNQWVLDFARRRPTLIAADDFSRLDERSAGFLALLAQQLGDRGLMLAVTVETAANDATSLRAARELLTAASTVMQLESLTLEQTEQLLESVFGEVPNLTAVASYLHGVASGNPRDTMQLAQHLVNEGIIQYSGGSWSVPTRLAAAALPANMDEALRARASKLSPTAGRVALALAGEPSLRFTYEECVGLGGPLQGRSVYQAIDELIAAEVVALSGARYGLRQQAWVDSLHALAAPEDLAFSSAALAEVLLRRGDEFRAAQHLMRSGASERGIDVLLEHTRKSKAASSVDPQSFFDMLETLPRDWLATYEQALELCAKLGRPARHAAVLRSRMDGIISHAISDTCGYEHIQERLDQLRSDCGLDLLPRFPADLSSADRMGEALAVAQARYDALPDTARVHSPSEALKELGQALISAVGAIAFTHRYEDFERLPHVAALASVAPAMRVVASLVEGVGERIGGRNERAIAIYDALLAGPFAKTATTHGRSHQVTARLRLVLSIATMEAALGITRCLERLAEVEEEPAYAAQALLARHLYYVWQGNVLEAARCKRQAEVLQIQSNSHHGFEGQHLFSELCAYALADDLTRVKRAADAVETRTTAHRAWLPMLYFARGEYHRIRGDHASARDELERALTMAMPGRSPIWAYAASAYLRVLGELGRDEEVLERGEVYLRAVECCELGYVRTYVRMPMALSCARLQQHTRATELADLVIAEFSALGTTGLNLALAYETRARVALLAGDRESFDALVRRCAEQWPGSEKRLLGIRYDDRGSIADTVDDRDELAVLSQFSGALENCVSGEQRALCGLEYLVNQSGAAGGLLYALTPRGLTNLASIGGVQRSEEIDGWASSYFEREVDREESTVLQDGDGAHSVATAAQELTQQGFMAVLLMHQTDRGLALCGLALLVASPDARYTHPGAVARELSRRLVECGDAIAVDS